jgi:hypothetical protein
MFSVRTERIGGNADAISVYRTAEWFAASPAVWLWKSAMDEVRLSDTERYCRRSSFSVRNTRLSILVVIARAAILVVPTLVALAASIHVTTVAVATDV